MPSVAQKAYFAIRAFNVELASVKDGHNVRRGGEKAQSRDTATTMVLQMRMQWWRDALKQIYGEEIENNKSSDPSTGMLNFSIDCWHSPIVRALAAANEEHDLTRRFLERLIDARDADLEVRQWNTLDEVATYSEESVSSLLYLSLECTGVREDKADEVASHAGVGIGLATALRATPFRLIHGEVPIPADLLHPGFPYHELVNWTNDEYTLTDSDAKLFDEAVKIVANTAASHLARARKLQGQVPKPGRPCLLPVIPALHYLSKLEQVDFQIFDPNLNDETRLRLLLLLGRTWLTGIF